MQTSIFSREKFKGIVSAYLSCSFFCLFFCCELLVYTLPTLKHKIYNEYHVKIVLYSLLRHDLH
jgi:hypothetical protein